MYVRSYQSSTQRPRQPYQGARPKKRSHGFVKFFAALIVVIGLVAGGAYALSGHSPKPTPASTTKQTATTSSSSSKNTSTSTGTSSSAAVDTTAAASNPCSTNTLSQLVLVSISQRHLWACDGNTVAYDSPVVTGIEYLAADLTPPGTYHVYAKETDQYLKGCDSTGCWDDYVNYWMPWLDNQYGAYGFHDATWRPASAFGNISPDSSNASHGCVECPLATAKWLYGWVNIGTTVTIQS